MSIRGQRPKLDPCNALFEARKDNPAVGRAGLHDVEESGSAVDELLETVGEIFHDFILLYLFRSEAPRGFGCWGGLDRGIFLLLASLDTHHPRLEILLPIPNVNDHLVPAPHQRVQAVNRGNEEGNLKTQRTISGSDNLKEATSGKNDLSIGPIWI